jgi:two-component system response regulator AlgR
MKLLVVDDEPLAQQRLKLLLQELDQVKKVHTANNGLQAVEACQNNKPDIILMDIRMPGIDGLEAAQHISQLDNPPAIIFTTAYDEYALEAFKVNAVDYLLKPVRKQKLKEAIEKACSLNHAQLTVIKEQQQTRSNITAKISGNIKLIPIKNILYFQAELKYVTVKYLNHQDTPLSNQPGYQTNNQQANNVLGETIIEDTLKELQNEFSDNFIRVHRNSMVAIQYITGVHRDNDGHSYVVLANTDKQLPISRRHLSAIKKLLNQL